jgi:hypothetical protein
LLKLRAEMGRKKMLSMLAEMCYRSWWLLMQSLFLQEMMANMAVSKLKEGILKLSQPRHSMIEEASSSSD